MKNEAVKSEAGFLSANIIISIVVLYLVSVTMIYLVTKSFNLVIMQTLWYSVGSVGIAIIRLFDTKLIEKYALWLYLGGILSLVAVLFFGSNINGAQRWLKFGPVSLQTSEFMKIFYVLFLARVIAKHRQTKERASDLQLIGKVCVVLVVPLIFILRQPDLGTAIVFVIITCGMLFIGGISKKIIALAILIGSTILGLFGYLVMFNRGLLLKIGFENYQFKRIDTWFDGSAVDADSAFNVEQAVKAIGSGGYFGNGFESQVYVPERHTDFIFSMIGETTGMIGCAILIIIYFFLMYYLIRTCFMTKTLYHTYVISGILILMSFHMFQNIAMNIGLMPVTGIPLPFISYGGSSILANMISLGIVLAIQKNHYESVFGKKRQYEETATNFEE